MQTTRAAPLHVLLTLLLTLVASGPVGCTRTGPEPRTLRVAAASSLRFALPEIIALFEKTAPGLRVEAVYGSSGTLSSQIASRAPFDVFLSADEKYATDLVKNRHGVGGSIIRYATGRLALWVPNASPVDVSKGLGALADPNVHKIAIANPALAPYGIAAEEALRKAVVYESLSSRIVMGENIAQAAQFVESGAAQAGIIALSLAESPEMKAKGRAWTIPETEHTPIIQSACISAYSSDKPLAQEFMVYMQSGAAQKVLRRRGFGIPGD